jgi:DNA-binding NarL/FixJ family response regulator
VAGEESAASDDYSYDEEPSASADASATPAAFDPAVVLIDPALTEDQRNALAAGLGAPLRALHPADFRTQPVQALDLAVIVALDLGLHSGLDAVEGLRRAGIQCAIAIASPAPTRALVRAAKRAGATTVIAQPYDVAEIERRVPFGSSASPAAGSEESAAGVSS